MQAIFKKEVHHFFSSITGYVAIVLFLVANALFLFIFPDTSLLDAGYAQLQGLFDLAPTLFLLLIPAITMRLFSDEFKLGTMELLSTKPLSWWDIVGGKYLAALLIVAIAILPTIFYFFVIQSLTAPGSQLDVGSIIGSYVGLFLLAAVFTAIGVWSSSLTSNAVVAFLVAVFASFILYHGFDAWSQLQIFNAGMDYYWRLAGIRYHYDSISRGVLDSRDLVYFFSIIGLMLYLTKLSLQRKLWQ
jgi:ABC-2 type transport system permease protein